MQKVNFTDIGRMGYQKAWDYQDEIVASIQEVKLRNRRENTELPTSNYLIFCEHPHVYTLGKSGSAQNLLWNDEDRKLKSVEFIHTNRGGDITYHGPGQIVGYPILDLDNFFTDLHKYLRSLEEVIIRTMNDFNIEAGRYQGLTGVWLDPEHPIKARKICAMGVKCSRWITMHGFALNVNPDLSFFKGIIPCGIQDKPVTSMEKELGTMPDLQKVKKQLQTHFEEVFQCTIVHKLPNQNVQTSNPE